MDERFISELAQQLPEAFGPDVPPSSRWGGMPLPEITLSTSDDDSGIQIPTIGDPLVIPGLPEIDYRLPGDGGEADVRVAEYGIDAIGCYISFHLDRSKWGIYIRENALERFARNMFGSLPRLTDYEKLIIAWRFVVDHELFHYWTDVACTQMEVVARQPVYLPYLKHYPDISSHLCQKEEAIANARAWRRLPTPEARDCAAVALKFHPPGYRYWTEYSTARSFAFGKRELGSAIQAIHGPTWYAAPFEWLFGEHRGAAGTSIVPFHWVRDPSRLGRPYLLHYARPIAIIETPGFLKQLEKMPRDVQWAWEGKTKPALQAGNWTGADFKKIYGKPDLYQCRVKYHFRAQFGRTSGDTFDAVDVVSRESL